MTDEQEPKQLSLELSSNEEREARLYFRILRINRINYDLVSLPADLNSLGLLNDDFRAAFDRMKAALWDFTDLLYENDGVGMPPHPRPKRYAVANLIPYPNPPSNVS